MGLIYVKKGHGLTVLENCILKGYDDGEYNSHIEQ